MFTQCLIGAGHWSRTYNSTQNGQNPCPNGKLSFS